ncbi:MAG TPA: DUF3291 domain-containing protein [Acidimicrobiales bacterium]
MAHHLAQVNVARLVADIDDPRIDEFREALERINKLGDESPGAMWRMKGGSESHGATDLRWPLTPDDPLMITNVTVWTDVESFRQFVYKSEHAEFLRRRRSWFEPSDEPQLAMWWVPAGHEPTLAEGAERLTHLRTHGPTPFAFTIRHPFPPPDE